MKKIIVILAGCLFCLVGIVLAADFEPYSAGAQSLGTAAKPWSNVYARVYHTYGDKALVESVTNSTLSVRYGTIVLTAGGVQTQTLDVAMANASYAVLLTPYGATTPTLAPSVSNGSQGVSSFIVMGDAASTNNFLVIGVK